LTAAIKATHIRFQQQAPVVRSGRGSISWFSDRVSKRVSLGSGRPDGGQFLDELYALSPDGKNVASLEVRELDHS
jgi:hypothetical protein